MLGHALIFVGLLTFYEGNWDVARALATSSASELDEIDSSQLGSYPPLGLGMLCLASGNREEARRHLDRAREIAEVSDGDSVLRLIETTLAEDELVRDQGEAACGRLIPVLEAGSLQKRMHIELQILLAWGTLLTGALAKAEAMAQDAVQSVRDSGMRLFLPDALRVRALCAIERREWQEATHALEEALMYCARMPYPYAEAKARYAYGRLWLARGEPGEACEQFERALAICDRLGERMYGAVIEKALRPFRPLSSAG
jgi:tetratricopeptide (TPR) repeat protein